MVDKFTYLFERKNFGGCVIANHLYDYFTMHEAAGEEIERFGDYVFHVVSIASNNVQLIGSDALEMTDWTFAYPLPHGFRTMKRDIVGFNKYTTLKDTLSRNPEFRGWSCISHTDFGIRAEMDIGSESCNETLLHYLPDEFCDFLTEEFIWAYHSPYRFSTKSMEDMFSGAVVSRLRMLIDKGKLKRGNVLFKNDSIKLEVGRFPDAYGGVLTVSFEGHNKFHYLFNRSLTKCYLI